MLPLGAQSKICFNPFGQLGRREMQTDDCFRGCPYSRSERALKGILQSACDPCVPTEGLAHVCVLAK